ncbi:MAG: CapA family protein [Acidimicrobiales bacterium]|nr:CapA family protein [Acidimicrobiales bacterium]
MGDRPRAGLAGIPPERRILVLVGAFASAAVLLLAIVALRGGDGDSSDDRAAAVWENNRRAVIDTRPATTRTTVAESTTTTTPPTPDRITLLFAGDLLPHSPVNERAAALGGSSGRRYDYAPMFDEMRPTISGADLAICHMEVPSAPDGERVTSYPSFGAPPELVDGAHSAGYDGCSTASNHSLDRGKAGIKRLLDQFDADGMKHAGTARTQQEADTTTVYDVHGVRVAHLSYAYDFNGYKLPADAPWSANKIDVAKIRAAAAKARSEGADLVVLSLHFGNEYQHDPSDYQRSIVDQLLPSKDISVIIGHHAHVVQPIEKVDGTFVVWGLGNQLSNQTQAPRRDGLTVRLNAGRGADGRWTISTIDAIPTYVDLPSFEVYPVVESLSDPSTPARLRPELEASYDRTAEVLAKIPTAGVTLAPKP